MHLLNLSASNVHLLLLPIYSVGLNTNASIEQAEFEQFEGVVFGNAQVTRKVFESNSTANHIHNNLLSFIAEFGRTDVVKGTYGFVFTATSKTAFQNFTIIDDDVLEFDEIFIAEFNFGPKIANTWNTRKGEPSTAFILIRDDDCELFSDSTKNNKD